MFEWLIPHGYRLARGMHYHSGMTYYESAKGIETDWDEARKVADQHGACPDEFQEWADQQVWPVDGQALLDWLGY